MTTRDEFVKMVDVLEDVAGGYECGYYEKRDRDKAHGDIVVAWATLAAEVERLRSDVDALRTGVPLTAENAPRARVVETREWPGLWVPSLRSDGYWERPSGLPVTTGTLIARGATVLAWSMP
jgi:outer membrane murein-binding lipoprotein Lpp